jgi:glycosyltransferase involved in cell wall biosynthesis
MSLIQFSIIIPLYNKASYIRKAVESVAEQTYKDWELVVVDDGSTDGSGNIVKAINDNRIRLVRQDNAGVSAARNRGVAESSAPYICFLDADDWWEPTFLEKMAVLVERYPDAGIYGTSYWIVKNGKKRLAPIGVDEGFVEGEINYCRVYAKTLCMPLTSSSICLPRRIFNETGGFPLGITLGEDFLFWLHLALSHKAILLNHPLANYNQDVDNAHRGTHRLHPPKQHMLWQLENYESLEKTNADYKQMIDNLRTYSLMNYLLDKQYRNAARTELDKVDWSHQPANTRRLYRNPIWVLHLRQFILKNGSHLKQRLLNS